MRAAVAARGDAPLRLLGVTVLTSMDDADLRDAGFAFSAADLVADRAADAKALGMDGIVASPAEAAAVRRIVGPDMAIVTPGIRPAGTGSGDQKRIATPAKRHRRRRRLPGRRPSGHHRRRPAGRGGSHHRRNRNRAGSKAGCMTKGYWIVRVDINDPETYKKYVAANAAAFKKYGGRFLVRAGKFEVLSGTARARNVVIEFKDFDTALACYRSPEYQHAIAERGTSAEVDVRGDRRL